MNINFFLTNLQVTCITLLLALSGIQSIYASVIEAQGKSSPIEASSVSSSVVPSSVSSSSSSQSSSVASSISSAASLPAGPEARQISTSNVVPTSVGSSASSPSAGSSSSSFPYSTLYQNALLNAALPQTPSSSGSWLSILRPSQGGRRASLTSRLRNIYNAIFR